MKSPMERHLDPVKLTIFFIAVTLTRGMTTPSSLNSTDDTTEPPPMLTNPTLLPGTLLNSSFESNTTATDAPNVVTEDTQIFPNTDAPNVVTEDTQIFPNTDAPDVVTEDTQIFPNTSDASSSSFRNITTGIVPTLQTDALTNTTSKPFFTDSISTADNITSTQGPLGPDGSINDTQPDPLGQLTTQALVTSTTPTVTPMTTSRQPPIAPQFTPPPFIGTNQINPYSNQLPRPRPLSPLTQQQQQRVLSPWLFAGSDYFPYMFLLSQQQPTQPGPSNSLSNGIAPLYLTGMDMELWPWLLAQPRFPQQQPALQPQPLPQQLGRSQPQPLPQQLGRSQPQPLPQQLGRSQPQPLPQQLGRSPPQPLPQPPRQPFANLNRFPQGQTRTPQQSQARNNLANLFWLNEIYF